MRILQVGKYLYPIPGGIETVVYELAKGLAADPSVDVQCLVSHIKPRTVTENRDRIKITRAARYGVVASTPLSPALSHYLRQVDVDLIHFHLPNPMATFSMNQISTPYVVTYHCDIVRYPLALKIYMPWLRRFLGKAKTIIVSSSNLIRNSQVLKEFSHSCQVIPFGIGTDHLIQTQDRQALIQKLKAKFGSRILLFVGRLVGYKGLDVLIRAMKSVDGCLLIVGEGPQRAPMEALAKRLHLNEKIHFMGFVPQHELGAYYHASKIMVLPSVNHSEAFGMCLLDALASGKPLVTTRLNTGVSEVNVEGVTGLQFPTGDVLALRKALTHLLDNAKVYEKMSHAAKDHFQAHFGYQKMITAHTQLYRAVLNR